MPDEIPVPPPADRCRSTTRRFRHRSCRPTIRTGAVAPPPGYRSAAVKPPVDDPGVPDGEKRLMWRPDAQAAEACVRGPRVSAASSSARPQGSLSARSTRSTTFVGGVGFSDTAGSFLPFALALMTFMSAGT